MNKNSDKKVPLYHVYQMMFRKNLFFTDNYETKDQIKSIEIFKHDLQFALYSSNYFQEQRKKSTPRFWRQHPELLIQWAKQNIPKSHFFYDEENYIYYFQDSDNTITLSKLYKDNKEQREYVKKIFN